MSTKPAAPVTYAFSAAQYFIDTFGRLDHHEGQQAARGFVESLGGDFDRLNSPTVSPEAASMYVAALVVRYAAHGDYDGK